jgi:hypothetical protein
MPALLIALMFFASAPFFLMPATIALWVRRPGSAVVLLINVGWWMLFYLSVRSFSATDHTGSLHLPFLPGAAGFLIGWLILLRYAISDTSIPAPPPSM